MQDFTNDNQLKLDIPQVASPQEPVPVIARSLKNKDNFWNLMFVLGMLVGSMTVGMLFSLIIMVFVLRKFNGVTINDNRIFNSEGMEIETKYLPNLAVIMFTSVMLCVFLSIQSRSLPGAVGSIKVFVCTIFIPALFFIFKNCPISVLFNLKLWIIPHPEGGYAYQPKRDHSTSSNEYFTNPRFSHLPNNVYNRNRLN